MYFGSFDGDELLDSAKTEKEKTDLYYNALRPAVDLGMSIGLDGAAGAAEDSLEYKLMSQLAQNTTVYIEGWPWMITPKPWLYNFNAEITADNYNQNWITKSFNNQTLITGEKIIIQTKPPQNHSWSDQADWQPEIIREYLRNDLTYM